METRTTTNRPKPKYVLEGDYLDALHAYTPLPIRGDRLHEGMVLLDDLDTAVYVLDHKIGRAHNGAATWMAADVENGGWTNIRINQRNTINVAAE